MAKWAAPLVAAAFAFAATNVSAIQHASPRQVLKQDKFYKTDDLPDGMELVELDSSEVQERGSYCLDGSIPGFYLKTSNSTQWIISFMGGEWCKTEEDCVDKASGEFMTHEGDEKKVNMSIFSSGDFADYNQVMFHHCDAGLWMGDRTYPLQSGGKTLYFRGKRIVDHVIDTLKTTSSLNTASEVIVTGGSGGGVATFLLSDYLSGLMPASVRKFGGIPQNGWYPSTFDSKVDEDVKTGFELHNMSSALVPSCIQGMAEDEKYKCLYTDVAYPYSKTPIFMVQMFDRLIVRQFAPDKKTRTKIKAAHSNCFEDGDDSCGPDDVNLLQGLLDNFTGSMKSLSKYSQQGEGGFLSTCTKHVYYKLEEYFHYANNGVAVADAVTSWWNSFGTVGATWHLPCDLKADHPEDPQCEESCHYESSSDDDDDL